METVLTALAAYCLGSISFAIVVSRLMRLPDPRSYGSKNPGATNVLRTGRKAAAVLTLAGDAGKGWLAVWLAAQLGWRCSGVAGFAVFVGHLYPLFHRFRGGKGVATAAGVLFGSQSLAGSRHPRDLDRDRAVLPLLLARFARRRPQGRRSTHGFWGGSELSDRCGGAARSLLRGATGKTSRVCVPAPSAARTEKG